MTHISWQLFLYLLFGFLQTVFSNNIVKKQLINDYVTKQDKTQINAYLCWNKDNLMKMQNMIFEKNCFASTINPNNKNIDILLTQKNLEDGLIILDFTCTNSQDILSMANEKSLFRRNFRWLLLSNRTSHHAFSYLFDELDIFIDSLVVYVKEIDEYKYELRYIYKLGKNSEILTNDLATWKYDEGFLYYNSEIIARRRNLRKYKLKTAFNIINNESLKHLNDYRHSEVDTMTKVGYPLAQHLMDYINATNEKQFFYHFAMSPKENNYRTSVHGLLNYKKIDLAGVPLLYVKTYVDFMDAVATVMPARSSFIFRQPPLSYVEDIYALPFELKLWLTIMAFLIISATLLFIITLWEWKLLDEKHTKSEYDMIHPTFTDALLFVIGGVCQQGYATEPKGLPGKILILSLFFTLIFLFTAYSAYTVVLFQETADNINTLEDLYESGIELGVDDKPYVKALFESNLEGIREKLYREKIYSGGERSNFYPITVGLEKVRTKYFAFHAAQFYAYKLIEEMFMDHEKCGLKEVKYFPNIQIWTAAPKHSPFLEQFRTGYLKIQEAGLKHCELKRRIPPKPKCLSQGSNYRSAGIIDLRSIYYLLIVGTSAALVIFVFEIALHNYLTCNKFV